VSGPRTALHRTRNASRPRHQRRNGGPELDPANARSICSPCNLRKASAEGTAATTTPKQRPTPLHPGLH
jgi:5-methylcytosine-specific restriction endonuclease McrA